ncbi:glycine dehydrogenase [Xanthomonas oryzae pv. oryzae PXO99A]|uniref:Glycine dehydrogenase n=1 Tax=Xanthomonas oryzae pv. oryzae (strain PXO99A) TaxID=360094 RepID=A0A0K0GKS4_XANOP|nr:glycine dehydrogenase [Xanthomonas oryzae pv. oryzae PXO99A]
MDGWQRTYPRWRGCLDSISKCNTLSAVRVCTCQKAINTSVRKSAQCSRSRGGAVKVCARFPGF